MSIGTKPPVGSTTPTTIATRPADLEGCPNDVNAPEHPNNPTVPTHLIAGPHNGLSGCEARPGFQGGVISHKGIRQNTSLSLQDNGSPDDGHKRATPNSYTTDPRRLLLDSLIDPTRQAANEAIVDLYHRLSITEIDGKRATHHQRHDVDDILQAEIPLELISYSFVEILLRSAEFAHAYLDGQSHDPSKFAHTLDRILLRYERELARTFTEVDTVKGLSRIAAKALDIAHAGRGFFLKSEILETLLRQNPPTSLLNQYGAQDVATLLRELDVKTAFSLARYAEDDNWRHGIHRSLSLHKPSDIFEEREITPIILDSAPPHIKAFFEKKLPFSNDKLAGTIIGTPTNVDDTNRTPVLRALTRALHYVHELDFYSQIFRSRVNEHIEDGLITADGIRRSLENDIYADHLFQTHPTSEVFFFYRALKDLEDNEGLSYPQELRGLPFAQITHDGSRFHIHSVIDRITTLSKGYESDLHGRRYLRLAPVVTYFRETQHVRRILSLCYLNPYIISLAMRNGFNPGQIRPIDLNEHLADYGKLVREYGNLTKPNAWICEHINAHIAHLPGDGTASHLRDSWRKVADNKNNPIYVALSNLYQAGMGVDMLRRIIDIMFGLGINVSIVPAATYQISHIVKYMSPYLLQGNTRKYGKYARMPGFNHREPTDHSGQITVPINPIHSDRPIMALAREYAALREEQERLVLSPNPYGKIREEIARTSHLFIERTLRTIVPIIWQELELPASTKAAFYLREMKSYASDLDMFYWGPKRDEVNKRLTEQLFQIGFERDLFITTFITDMVERGAVNYDLYHHFFNGRVIEFNGGSFDDFYRGQIESRVDRGELFSEVYPHLSKLLAIASNKGPVDLNLDVNNFKKVIYHSVTHLIFCLAHKFKFGFRPDDGTLQSTLRQHIDEDEVAIIEDATAFVLQARNIRQVITQRRWEDALDARTMSAIEGIFANQGLPDCWSKRDELGLALEQIRERYFGAPDLSSTRHFSMQRNNEAQERAFKKTAQMYLEIVEE